MPQRKKNTSIIASLTAIKRDVATIKKNYVTKQDLKNFATKDDLKRFATKDDVNNTVNNAVKDLATRKDFGDIMWELKTMREENAVLSDMKRQVNEHEDRLETVENKLGVTTGL